MTDPIARTARYQDDLARLLAALEPVERAEVLDGVREHIDAALAEVGHAPTDADVDRILGQLGSPGMVAEAALAERAGVQVPGPNDRLGPAGGPWREQLMGRWVPPTVTIGMFVLGLMGFLAWIPLAALLVLLVLSGLWTVPEKVIGAVVVPVGLASTTFMALTGRSLLGTVPTLILTVAALAVLVVIGYRGGKRAKQHAEKAAAAAAGYDRGNRSVAGPRSGS